jgi:hypothetical protein
VYFFEGLKYVQEIAEQGPSEVRLDMVNENNNAGYETCQDFKLTDGIQYTLHIGTCNSFAGTRMKRKNRNSLEPFLKMCSLHLSVVLAR